MFNSKSRELKPDYSVENMNESFGVSGKLTNELEDLGYELVHEAIQPYSKKGEMGIAVHKKDIIQGILDEVGAITHEQAFYIGMITARAIGHADEKASEMSKEIAEKVNALVAKVEAEKAAAEKPAKKARTQKAKEAPKTEVKKEAE